jgi:hypothetical protein
MASAFARGNGKAARKPDQPPAFDQFRLRPGCLSNRTALAMVFKLVEAAQKNWRRLDGNQLPKGLILRAISDFGGRAHRKLGSASLGILFKPIGCRRAGA